MCVTSGKARLSRTFGLAALAQRDGRDVHVLGYENHALNLTGQPNCMLLHIPSWATMGPENFVDTTGHPRLFERLIEATRPPLRGIPSRSGMEQAAVFDSGMYTVVLADRAALVPAALQRVPRARRPVIPDDILAFYEQTFPGWHLALCCWDGLQPMASQPLLFWFEPLRPEVLFIPGLDAHDGGPPQLGQTVLTDHTLFFGAKEYLFSTTHVGRPVRHDFLRRLPEEIRRLMPTRGQDWDFAEACFNGDFEMRVDELLRGGFHVERAVAGVAQRGVRPAPPPSSGTGFQPPPAARSSGTFRPPPSLPPTGRFRPPPSLPAGTFEPPAPKLWDEPPASPPPGAFFR